MSDSHCIQIGLAEYREKVRGCWLGKNIGGTLGTPYESTKYVNGLTFYDPVPDKPLPNDDLDLQLVWLKMLEDNAAAVPSLADFAGYWLKYLRAYPYSEYGICLQNLEAGLRPPICGCFQNGYVDNMGSPIRSEIWACIAPGDPQLAAALAHQDAILDHAGGEGVYGEMFWAAVQSAAFVLSDPQTLIRIGLAMIPLTSHIARAIRETLHCHQQGMSWAQARDHIALRFSNPGLSVNQGYGHPSLAAPNHAFTIIGWLYGEDFGDSLLKAVNCGYDTDCTGATLGALLGILDGARSIPARWKNPVGNGIVLHEYTAKFNHPKTIMELTARTEAIARRFVKAQSNVADFGAKTVVPKNLASLLIRNEQAIEILARCDWHSAVETDKDLEITFHYGREPVLYPGIEMPVNISLRRNGSAVDDAEITLRGPKAWKIERQGPASFTVFAKAVASKGNVTVSVKSSRERYSAKFTLLSSDQVSGYQWHVPMCPKCGGRVGACLCRS